MATLTINIPDAQVAEVRDAFAVRFNYNPDGPENKTQFFKRMVAEFIKGVYQDNAAQVASENARIESVNTTNAVVID